MKATHLMGKGLPVAELAPRPLTTRSLYDPTFGDIEDLAGLLLQAAAEGDGGTFHMGTHATPSRGYAVANRWCEMVLMGDPPLSVVATWLDAVVRPFAGEVFSYVGVWRDAKTDRIHFDCVCIETDGDRAMELGRQMKQMAIYDLYASEEIRL